MTFALGPGTGPANRPNGFLALSDFQTPNNLEFDVDDGGYKLFVEIVCAGLGGVIPVVGSIGAFLICGKQVDDRSAKLNGPIEEAWAGGVQKFNLEPYLPIGAVPCRRARCSPPPDERHLSRH